MRQIIREGIDRRYVLLPLVSAVVLVISAYFFAEARRTQMRALNEVIRDRQELMREVAELNRTTMDAESAQRGFLLTGDPQYLEPYQKASLSTMDLVAHLKLRYSARDAQEVQELTTVQTLIQQRFAEMDKTLDQMRENKVRAALAVVNTDNGLRMAGEIRDKLDALQGRERNRTYEGLQGWNDYIDRTKLVNRISTSFTILLMIALGFLVTREIRRRDFANNELQRLVEDRTGNLRELSHHMVRISEREKSALARELHDELGGILVAMQMDLAQLRRQIQRPGADTEALWSRVQTSIKDGIQLKRRVIEELRPTLLDNLGLVAAIRWQAEQSCELGRIQLDTESPEEEVAMPADASIAVFRTVQEAFSNVLKHSRATRVKITIRCDQCGLSVDIEDNGVGLPTGAMQKVGSHGLKQMSFRMQAVRGSVTIGRMDPQGTRVSVYLPAELAQP